MMLAITVVGLFLNFIVLWPAYSTHELFSAKDVKSVSVYYKNKPYFLNFKEQKQFLSLLNQGEALENLENITKEKNLPLPIDKLVVYRFEHPAIDLIPIALVDDKMIFRVVGLENIHFIIEKEPGKLENLLNSTYDR